MPVTDIRKDLDALTLTVTAEFAAPVERIWEMWSDPRQLERWWGPPSHPATVVEHDLTPGGGVAYYMTAPDGQQFHGLWEVEQVEPPTRLRFEDAFADEHGNRNEEMPTSIATVTLVAGGPGTTMTIESRYATREGLEQVVAMGMEEGIKQAIEQIDGLVAVRT